jgi:hypothetical protein
MRTRDGAVRGNEGCRPGVWMTGCLRRGVNGLDAGGRRRGWSNGLQVGSAEVEGAGACRFQKLLGTQPGRAAFRSVRQRPGGVVVCVAQAGRSWPAPSRVPAGPGLGRSRADCVGPGRRAAHGAAGSARLEPCEGRMGLPQVLRAVTWAGRAAWREESGPPGFHGWLGEAFQFFYSLGSAAGLHPGGVNPPEQPVQGFLDSNLKNMPARSRT